ncbi:MAG: hypothetical protein L0323_03135 [Planctomycetes bacterium]|nr:hypothetical protein [Planctomycetota bacterium]
MRRASVVGLLLASGALLAWLVPEGRLLRKPSVQPEPPLFAVSVLVLDPGGEPVPGARVEVHSRGWWSDCVVLEVWPTDDSGRCTVTARSRQNALLALKAGTGTSGEWPLDWLGENQTEVTLSLRAQAKVRGLVLRVDGTPALGATVSFWSSGSCPEGIPHVPPAQTTDAEGRFEVEVDSWGTYRLAAEHGEMRTGEWPVQPKPGATKEVTLRFPGTFSISGTLFDPDGRRVPGGMILAREEPPPGEWSNQAMSWGKSGPDGSFRLEVPRLGEYAVTGYADGFIETATVPVRLTERAPMDSVSLSLLPESFIAGRVRRWTGEPALGATVWASVWAFSGCSGGIRAEFPGAPDGSSKPHHLRATTGPDGSFRLEPAHPGREYSVICVPDRERMEGEIRRTNVVPGGAPLEIVVTDEELRGAVLTGVVESKTTGRPLERFRLTLSHQAAGVAGWTLDGQPRKLEHSEGRFRIEGLTAGCRYGLEVEADGHSGVLIEPWTMEPQGRELHVRLPGPSRLEVRVVGIAGGPVPFAQVSLLRKSEVPGRRFWQPVRTDPSGIGTVEGIDVGRYVLRATKGAARSEAVEVEVRGGSTTTVSITLPK